MGIREDQLKGLNEWALDFVKGKPILAYTEEIVHVYPDGRRDILQPREVYKSGVEKEKSGETYRGMFGNDYHLHKYIFSDGKIYFEKVQESPWSSGPVFFLALQDEKGDWVKESLWPQTEIDNA